MPSVRVLVVDNQSEGEDMVSLFLRRWGNEVCTVPELVMVHVDGPEFDAISLVKRFRRRHSFGSVPLIAMSIERGSASRRAGIAAGFDQWLVKPVPLDELSGLFSDVRATIRCPKGWPSERSTRLHSLTPCS